MSLTPGARLGPYEIVAAIGAGGMGEVYRAHDARLNRDVAIKILRDGRELYYLSGTVGRYKMMAVPFENGAHELRLGAETALFDVRINNIVPQSNIFQYSPSADGQRFLVNAPTSDAEPTLNVISNWKAMARVASGKE